MNSIFKTPPASPTLLSSPEDLKALFHPLIGSAFKLTGKTRTDGSNLRKLIAATLEKGSLPKPADLESFEIVPPKKKGVPKITLEFIDTYIITSGTSYNLQVWNRIPASSTLLVKYDSGESLSCQDVRFVFVRVDVDHLTIDSILILTPTYIEKKFGRFGRPTVKHQLLISRKVRADIIAREDKILSYTDSKKLIYKVKDTYTKPERGILSEPDPQSLFSISLLKSIVAEKLIGQTLDQAATKNRGQALERLTLNLLGYSEEQNKTLHGGFPDIKEQLLEVKVQESPTVDLGMFTPEAEEVVIEESGLTTFDVRYLIALTNPISGIIEGIILAPGEKLGDVFSYVSDQSYKCQRSIPMSFFDQYSGQVAYNP